MNILLIAGHGDGDPGAYSDGYQEQYLTREFAKLLKSSLERYQCNVDIAPDSRNYYHYLHSHGFDFSYYHYVIEIHFNAGGGYGSEIFVPPGTTGINVEKQIMKHISAYTELKNRGVKTGNYYVIKKIKKSGVDSALLEVCFIDSKSDMNIYEDKKEKIAQAVADGTAKGFGLKLKKENKTMELKQLENRVSELEKRLAIYNYIDSNMSDAYKPTIKKLVDKGYLKGDSSGLHLSEDMMRILTILDRAGLFGVPWEHEK